MGWDRFWRTLAAVACALAFAGAAPSDLPELPQPPEPVVTPPAEPEPVAAGQMATPPPSGMARLPTVSSDAPVPYYSQIAPADDIPNYSPMFELDPSEVKLGLITSAEVSYVQPYVHNQLSSAGLSAGALPDSISTPTAQPGWSALPRVDLGYRFQQGLGEVHANFQFLSSQGTGTLANFDRAGAGTVTTRLNLDIVDLDYACTEFNPGRVPRVSPLLLIPGRLGLNLHPEDDPFPMFRMRWAFGARGANVFFATQGAGAQILAQRVMNNFAGAGLHTYVDLSKPIPWSPRLEVFGRLELSGLFGETTQSFSRTEIVTGGATVSGAARRTFSTGVPVLEAYAGLAYVPRWFSSNLRVTGGYRLQQWWYLGQDPNSGAGLTLQGFFLRGEFGY